MNPTFHLSIGVRSVEESADFFVRVLRGTVSHRDPSGYVNIDLFGSEITLKQNAVTAAATPEFHFGVNMSLADFEELAQHVMQSGYHGVVMTPNVVDTGTPTERKKMYVRCPSGYLIELKGYK